MKHFLILGLAVLAASCATDVVTPSETHNAVATGPLDLGDYQHADVNAVVQSFETSANAHYAAGQAFAPVLADLHTNQFNCAANHDASHVGDPPAQICRKTVTESGCTYTWQVHLFDNHGDAHIARTRELFDKRCGHEGLLGGPS